MIVRWDGGGVMCLCSAHRPNTADARMRDNVPLTIEQRLQSAQSLWEAMSTCVCLKPLGPLLSCHQDRPETLMAGRLLTPL